MAIEEPVVLANFCSLLGWAELDVFPLFSCSNEAQNSFKPMIIEGNNLSLNIENLQKQLSTNQQTINQLTANIKEYEKLTTFNSFDSVLMYFLRENLGFDYEKEKPKLRQSIGDGYTQISKLDQENALLEMRINSLKCSQQCEINKVTFAGQGLIKVDGVTATFKCMVCGQEFTRDLSQIRGLDNVARIERVAGCRDELEYQKECVRPGLNIIEVCCPCGKVHLILIHRSFNQ